LLVGQRFRAELSGLGEFELSQESGACGGSRGLDTVEVLTPLSQQRRAAIIKGRLINRAIDQVVGEALETGVTLFQPQLALLARLFLLGNEFGFLAEDQVPQVPQLLVAECG
jgi:hypothetical protein